MALLAPTNYPRLKCEKTQINNLFESIQDEDVPYSIVVETITAEETGGMFQTFCIAFFCVFFYMYIIYSIRSIRKSLTHHFFTNSEAATGYVLWEKVFLEISQNSQENTCVRDFFKKVATLLKRPATFLKNCLLVQMFSCEFCEISKNTFFAEHLRWLLPYHSKTSTCFVSWFKRL